MSHRRSGPSFSTPVAILALGLLTLVGCGGTDPTVSQAPTTSEAPPTSTPPPTGVTLAVGERCEASGSGCPAIRSDRIGPLSIAMPNDEAIADGWAFEPFIDGGPLGCGYLHKSDVGVSGQSYDGQVDFVETDNVNDRTAEDVGPGSTYRELQAAFPGKLEVHTSRGPNSWARYRAVVILKQGDNALTFKMDSPLDQPLAESATVDRVKLSTWDWRGDDEGCA